MPRRPPEFLVLALDIGSSSTRSALFDEQGLAFAETNACREYSVRYTGNGGAELSPLLLRRAVASCLRETLKTRRDSSSLRRIPIVATGASGFWHSLLGLDGKDHPITPVFTWADSRCAPDGAQLRGEFDERRIQAQTGCMLRASFWPAKLRWLRRTQGSVFNRAARWVSPAEWIFAELFGASGCSHSMASATGLYDLRMKRWDPLLCNACGIAIDQLSELTDLVLDKTTQRELRDAKFFPAIGDGAAGNLGCGADGASRIAINIGTSAAVRMMETNSVARPAPFGLFRYVVDRERTVLGGAVSNAGNLRRWCLRELSLSESAAGEEKMLSRTAAATDELTVLPFWVNERAPTWPENLRGAVIGLNQASSASQLLRSTTSAVYYRLGEILDIIESTAGRSEEVIVSGGILHSRASLCLLADALDRDLRVSSELEASLRGAAVYVLEKLGREVAPLRKGNIVRHDRALAKKHRIRRERQVALEKLLSIDLSG